MWSDEQWAAWIELSWLLSASHAECWWQEQQDKYVAYQKEHDEKKARMGEAYFIMKAQKKLNKRKHDDKKSNDKKSKQRHDDKKSMMTSIRAPANPAAWKHFDEVLVVRAPANPASVDENRDEKSKKWVSVCGDIGYEEL